MEQGLKPLKMALFTMESGTWVMQKVKVHSQMLMVSSILALGTEAKHMDWESIFIATALFFRVNSKTICQLWVQKSGLMALSMKVSFKMERNVVLG